MHGTTDAMALDRKAWDMIYADFLGPYHGDMYLVVVDAYSKWPEVANFRNNTQTYNVIEAFNELFARHVLPNLVITDIGPQHRSDELKEFFKSNGVKDSRSPLYHPAMNGVVKNFVGTFKDKVSNIIKGRENIEKAIHTFMFDYRSTPHCTTGKLPASLFCNRELKTRFDLLRPNK